MSSTLDREGLSTYLDVDHGPLAMVVDLVRRGVATTRQDLVAASGLGRKVVAQRVDAAIAAGFLLEGESARPTGGRPSRTIEFDTTLAVVGSIVVGISELAVALLDLGGNVVGVRNDAWDARVGPEETISAAVSSLRSMLANSVAPLWAITVGVPCPVDIRSGVLKDPPAMPAWDGFDLTGRLRVDFDVPIYAENDANLMAIGELHARGTGADSDILFVNMGSSIGTGIVLDGELVRGHRGGVGDIGHISVSNDPTVTCRCGRTGCLDAVAAGWSILERAEDLIQGSPSLGETMRTSGRLTLVDIGRSARSEDPMVLRICQEAVDVTAGLIADLTSFLNPSTVVIGGGILEVGTWVPERFRSVILARVGDRVQKDLSIRPAVLPQTAGIVGGGLLARERILHPTALSRWIGHGSPL